MLSYILHQALDSRQRPLLISRLIVQHTKNAASRQAHSIRDAFLRCWI